jgi:PRTRC genetic system protein E
MTTNFFKNITDLKVPGKWNLAIHSDEQENLTISALFTALHNSDNATKAIPPMLLKGSAEELDSGFFEAIPQPVQQTSGLYTTLNDYHKELEKAKQASKMEQEKKNKAAKQKVERKEGAKEDDIEMSEPKPDKEAQRKAYEETMKRMTEHDSLCQYHEALELLPSITDFPEKTVELTKKRTDLERKREQKNAFLF